MKVEDIEKLVKVRTVEDVEDLPFDTEYIFTDGLDDPKIHALSRLKHLKFLINDGNSFVTNAGLKILSTFQSLKELDLEWSDDITDEGLVYLEGLAQLESLDIDFCHKTSPQGVNRLKEALPNCEVTAERFNKSNYI